MTISRWVLVSAVLFAGCFEEGGDTARNAAALTTAQGLIAFGDIHSNIETDPAAAGVALLEFLKWPVAADSLVSPPFEGAAMVMGETSPRLAPASPVPGCLTQIGEPSCDTYVTNDTCEAGGFQFSGVMARRCSDCDDPRGYCAYGWVLPRLDYTSDKFSLTMSTAGSWRGTTAQVSPNLSARYDLKLAGRTTRTGNLTACACTVFTVVDDPTTESGKPRKLVNSSFVVRAAKSAKQPADACALVNFDSNGNVSIQEDCSCPGGDVCSGPDPTVIWPPACGNRVCEPANAETYESCPVDCPFEFTTCGNDKCEISETEESCPADCGLQL